jgi:adenylate kinase
MLKKLLLLIYLLTIAPVLSIQNFVLISAPGSGKGTFSQYLIQKYNYIQICPGDLLRAEIVAQTDFGKKIQPIVEKGEYIDEEVTCQLITKHLIIAIQQNKPFIIDGFPRTKTSLEFLDNFSNNII